MGMRSLVRRGGKEGTMAKKSSMDLTEGNIAKQIILFALPILLGQVFQNLYNSVDSIVVGNFVSTTALAAVTSSADISRLLVGFFTGLSAGSGVLFARYFGAHDDKKLHDSIHTALLFALVLGVLMAGVGILITPLLLRLVDCPADVWGESVVYLRIYFVGVLFTSLYNVASGVLRAVGDSQHPFYYLVIASCTNIVLDLLFVAVFQMGVAGTAIATIISQLLSVFLAVRQMLTTNDVYKLVPKDLKIDGAILKEVLVLGLPAAIQSGLISLSNLFVQRYINGFGSAAMAGTGAAKKIDSYVGMVAQSLGLAVPTFISQNIGAQKPQRAFRGLWTVVTLGFGTIAILGPIIFFNSQFFVQLFTRDPAAVAFGMGMIRVMLPLYGLQTLFQVFSNAVRGFGKSIVTMFTSIGGLIVCRQIFLAYSMSVNPVIDNVFWGYPVGWGCAAGMSILYYLFAIRLPYRKREGAVSSADRLE